MSWKKDLRKRPRKLDDAMPSGKRWRIRVGERAKSIRNPIREIMDSVAGKENPAKKLVSLAQGDPTSYPRLCRRT
ncbi:Tyrosine aminotransferase [Symbiodinium microadriaticum]|uniref:Tyrosine aminotransferase n=1 Tax=Symbiodinium microadriaticum TaxID=2951 RepID=A0A1Q9BW02_SYMMI|nr:Tyrosine aminotransferase [Symbiodinium microadriaticum]